MKEFEVIRPMQSASRSVSQQDILSLRPDTAALFAAEGALLQLMTSVNSFGNNLFASALGATDSQLGLVQSIPNAAVLILLIPVGILADRLRSSRTIPVLSLLCVALGYLMMAAAASLSALPLYFVALALTVGAPIIFNAQWQNFFGDVVRSNGRNHILKLRNQSMLIVAIIVPFVCSALMGKSVGLNLYRNLFLVCAVAALVQAAVLTGIPVTQRCHLPAQREKLTATWKQLVANRTFLRFFLPITFFYIGWHIDWSMWYIAQVQYLGFTQAQFTIHNGIISIGQLVAVGIMARGVQKWGADRVLPMASVGLMFCPLIVMFCSILPSAAQFPAFTGLVTVLNMTQCVPNLCIVQILLRVAPKSCRGAAVSLYTLAMTLSNCIMPYLGVQLYTALGANYRALILFNLTAFVLRVAALILLVRRCKYAE